MARPKGDTPPREYINARIRKDLFDEITELTKGGNPSRSQAVEQAVEMWLNSVRAKLPVKPSRHRPTKATRDA